MHGGTTECLKAVGLEDSDRNKQILQIISDLHDEYQ